MKLSDIRVVYKAIRVGCSVVWFYGRCRFYLHRKPIEYRLEQSSRWAKTLLHHLSIHLNIQPNDQSIDSIGPGLYVANHLSWVDILVIHAYRPSIFISKSEVLEWPVFGKIAHTCGVIFVNRESKKSMLNSIERASQYLRQGMSVAVFPEGTSTDGTQPIQFKSNFFTSAIASDSKVFPLALQYIDQHSKERSKDILYFADQTFINSLIDILKLNAVIAKLHKLEHMHSVGLNRKTLSQVIQLRIQLDLDQSLPASP